MFIGHIPAGYITSVMLLNQFKLRGISETSFILSGLCGAIIPDCDLIYFYLIDHRQHPHHMYFTHWPIVWFSLLVISCLWLQKNHTKAILMFICCLNACIHIVLDTIAGNIRWFAPFTNDYFSLFTVPAIYTPWWLNFMLHWSFAIELSLVVWALILYNKHKKN